MGKSAAFTDSKAMNGESDRSCHQQYFKPLSLSVSLQIPGRLVIYTYKSVYMYMQENTADGEKSEQELLRSVR